MLTRDLPRAVTFEALSLRRFTHAFRVLPLSSGQFAIYNTAGDFQYMVDDLSEIEFSSIKQREYHTQAEERPRARQGYHSLDLNVELDL